MIEAYVDALDCSLRGPRRVKADLLAEARDALVDTATAYEREGLERPAAEARAVAEFGTVDEVGPDYQAELAFSQGRRTGLFLFFVLIGQAVAWRMVWPQIRPGPAGDPTPASAALGQAVGWLSGVALAGSLVSILACGVGVRWLGGASPRVIRGTGALALTVATSLTVLSAVLALVAPRTGSLLSLSVGLPWSIAFLLIPMAGVAVSGRRCLVAAP